MERRISLKDRYPLDSPVTATGLNVVIDPEGAAVETWARSQTSTSHDRIRLTGDLFASTWEAAVNRGLLKLESPEKTGSEEGLFATRIEVNWEEGERSLEGWDLRDSPEYAGLISLLEALAPESMERVLAAVEPINTGEEP